jgi:hypothetical protein
MNARQNISVTIACSLLLVMGCGGNKADGASDIPSDNGGDVPEVDLISEGIVYLNTLRAAAGLTPVVLDSELSQGCSAHIDYMLATGNVVHREDPSHPRYTVEGAQAGKNATLTAGVLDLEDAIDAWVMEIYHRLPLLHPGLTAVGAAFSENHACLDVFSAHQPVPGHPPIAYPGADQTHIPTTYPGHGAATPLPAELSPPVGFIISLMLSTSLTLGSDVMATLDDVGTGEPVDVLILPPKSPTDPFATFQQNAILIVPHDELTPHTTYRVTVTGTTHLDRREESVTMSLNEAWEFTTAD